MWKNGVTTASNVEFIYRFRGSFHVLLSNRNCLIHLDEYLMHA